jgi:hypothetical protein
MKKFATESEEQFSQILDYHGLEWEYEPTTFALTYDESGAINRAFTPDFYIPKWNVYVEITMMRSVSCTRKNRKIRETKELYPDIDIILMNKHSMTQLLEMYKFLFYTGEDE